MSHRDFSEQVVVVTGASGGVGAAVAEELARRGASVVLAARRAGPLGDVARRCGSQALAVVADMTKRDDVQRLFDEALARFGRVDIWINNVGRGIGRPLLEITDDDVDAMIRDNLKSVLYGMQVVTPHLQARGTGAIVNVSSLLGRIPLPPRAAYAASKAAMMSLSEAFRMELAGSHPHLRVVVVYPGRITTDFGRNALGQPTAPSARLPAEALAAVSGAPQTAEEVAHVVCDAALNARGDVYTQPDASTHVRAYQEKQS
ncbi:SDR family oxidoreductase [Archangium primigenium]|uniref:SDR family oxidoreductase n=1 Tax=[Archangium] primigenium TaxID=2792470 RepID=UPI00195612EB|nr:SDR family oxidoreductase [Archangium primigenium]MBM7116029.1 SDR family oxidoreductase [Archangium primigenium]